LLKRRIYLKKKIKSALKKGKKAKMANLPCSYKRQKWQICLFKNKQKVKDYPHSIFELLKNEKGVSVIFK